MNETKLLFQFKRYDLQLEQLRSQIKHISELNRKLAADLESFKAKSGSVEAGNMPSGDTVPNDEAVHK